MAQTHPEVAEVGDRLDQGFVQVYTGTGKGKTTAAFGQALRAYGAGLKVAIVQFLKVGDSGEVKALQTKIPEIAVFSYGTGGFVVPSSSKQEHRDQCSKAMDKAWEILNSNEVDVLVLDEICTAVEAEVLEERLVIELINSRPKNLELILTGRGAGEKLLGAAHLVTEMQEIKHPYQTGVAARKGIEY